MKIAFFSTCSAKGYEQFGRTYIEQFLRHMPKEVDLHVFTDGWTPDVENDGRATRLVYHRCEDVQLLQEFLGKHRDDASKCGIFEKDGVPQRDYRRDAVTYSHVVYPLSWFVPPDGPLKSYDWVVRLDMDVTFKGDVPISFWEELLEPQYAAVYLGRQDWPHSETGFVAYNLQKGAGGYALLSGMLNCYDTGRIFNLQGQTDCDVFDHVRDTMCDTHQKLFLFKNLSESCTGMHVWPQTVLAQHMTHHKGPAAKCGVQGLNDVPKTHEEQAVHTIASFKPRSIVDVGVMDGQRAVNFARTSLWAQRQSNKKPAVHLWAMDPGFGQGALAIDALEQLALEDSSFTYTYINLDENPELWNPDNQVEHPTLGSLLLSESDFAYVDGDHSVPALQRDLGLLQNVKLVMTPTYFLPGEQGSGQDTTQVGCNNLLGNVQHTILPVAASCLGGGMARTVAFGLAMQPQTATGTPRIRTKNAVPNEIIIENVTHAIQYEEGYAEAKSIEGKRRVPFAKRCKIHDLTALIIGGGPSVVNPEHPNYEKNWKAINRLRRRKKVKTFVVKTAHDHMVYDRKEPPFGCLLLDPRDHVQEFVSEPHPDVTYFVASMCHPTTWNLMVEKAKKLIGYHAVVKAGEVEHVHKVLKHSGTAFFGGGSSAASRGVGVLHGMGFRKFTIAGWDGHVWDQKVDHAETDKEGKPKWCKVKFEGQEYVSQPILIANVQDLENAMREHPDCEYVALTEGLAKVVIDKLDQEKLDFQKDYVARA